MPIFRSHTSSLGKLWSDLSLTLRLKEIIRKEQKHIKRWRCWKPRQSFSCFLGPRGPLVPPLSPRVWVRAKNLDQLYSEINDHIIALGDNPFFTWMNIFFEWIIFYFFWMNKFFEWIILDFLNKRFFEWIIFELFEWMNSLNG